MLCFGLIKNNFPNVIVLLEWQNIIFLMIAVFDLFASNFVRSLAFDFRNISNMLEINYLKFFFFLICSIMLK